MRSCIILILSVSLLWAQGQTADALKGHDESEVAGNIPTRGTGDGGGSGVGAAGERGYYESRLKFTSTQVVLADTCVDGMRFVPHYMDIERITVCFLHSGTSDSTIMTIMKVTDSTSRSVLASGDYLVIGGGDNRGCVEFRPVSRVELQEGDVIRWDILHTARGTPKKFIVTLHAKDAKSLL